MSIEIIALLVLGAIVFLIVAGITYKKLPKKIKPEHFAQKWGELQQFCKDKDTWPQALIEGDKLLDSALQKRRFKGKSMGERMVAAQKTFTNNDMVWYAHNLCKKVINDPELNVRESEIKDALFGFRQALRDLGALSSGDKK